MDVCWPSHPQLDDAAWAGVVSLVLNLNSIGMAYQLPLLVSLHASRNVFSKRPSWLVGTSDRWLRDVAVGACTGYSSSLLSLIGNCRADAGTTPSLSDSSDTAATTEDGDRTDEHCRLCESCLTVLFDYDIGNICSECNSSFGGPAPLRVSQALSSTADAAPPGAINALPDLSEHGPAVPPLQRRRLGSRQLRRQKRR